MATGLEFAAITLGSAVVKSACKVWLRDGTFASDVTSELIDAFASRVTNPFDQRKIGRFFEGCADIVAKRLTIFIEAEFARIPDNERIAAVLAVSDTFARTPLTDQTLFDADLDARLFERQLRPIAQTVLHEATLSEGGQELYRLVLRESCSYLVEVVTTLPKFTSGALTELLRRETAILDTLDTILDRLPERRGIDDFAADYSRAVANRLDRMELLGVTLADENRRYPLSVAYIDLSVEHAPGNEMRAAQALTQSRRMFIIGPAGSGKTTLLQWLAVRAARGDLPDAIPFFLPLRRYADQPLPPPQEFPHTIGAHIAHEMPDGWVHRLLRDGRAVVLIDGVDELPEVRRSAVHDWLSDLCATFPDTRYVVTSRPSAVSDGFLASLEFVSAKLLPMSATDVTTFVHQWHEAVTAELLDHAERNEIRAYENSFLVAIESDRHLRALAISPLLCALLCALNRERRTHLPNDKMETYAAALDTLIDRRDREREVSAGHVPLGHTDKILLLQGIAYWLVNNGWTDAPVDRVVPQVGRTLKSLRGITAPPETVFRALLERSGVLREPVSGRIDFIHRTFQEYLAGKAAVESDDIGVLLDNAHLDQWREVIIMAAGHARPDQAAELIEDLLKRGHRRRKNTGVPALAIAAGYTARQLNPSLRVSVDRAAAELVPPTTNEAIDALAAAGETLLDLLDRKPPRTPIEAGCSVLAAARVGGLDSLRLIARILGQFQDTGIVRNSVMTAWRLFNAEQFAREVLARSWPVSIDLKVDRRDQLAALRLIPELESITYSTPISEDPFVKPFRALQGSSALRSVTLISDGVFPDLSGLGELPALENVTLGGNTAPFLTDLGSITRPWSLTLSFKKVDPALHALGSCASLRSLSLDSCPDLTDLTLLQDRPAALRHLSLRNLQRLRSLSGIERWWNGLSSLDVCDCPHLEDLQAISKLKTLEQISLRGQPADLRALTFLPLLRQVDLDGDAFDLSCFTAARDLTITARADSELIGFDQIGAGITVCRTTRNDHPETR